MFKTFIRYMKLMGDRLPFFLFVVVCSTLGDAGRRIANSYLVKHIVTAAQTGDTEHILLLVFGNFVVFVLCLLLWRYGIIHCNIEGRTAAGKVEKLVFSKALRLPMSYYEKNHSSDFMSKLIFDTQRASDIYTSRLRRLLAAILSTVVYLIPMLYFSWELTLCLIGVSLLAFGANSLFMEPMKASGIQLSEKNRNMLEKLTSILSGMELVKIFPVGPKLSGEYEDSGEEYFHAQKKANRISSGLESLNCLFDLTGALAFLGLGIWFVSLGRIGLGELTALYTLYGSFRNVFLEIGLYLPQVMYCVGNAEKIFAFLDLEEEPEQWAPAMDGESGNRTGYGYSSGEAPVRCGNGYPSGSETDALPETDHDDSPKAEGNCEDIMLSMQNVSFSYSADRKVLENFSMEVKRGSFVAVVGESGCGKSTVAKLLLGFYPLEKGCIRMKGRKYSELTLKEIREQISYVPQEPYLYETTIAENIAYGRYGAGRDEIIAAARAANAHDFITKLPAGYDTVLGERGNTLSGGEKQRIAIARAILRNSPVIILDEATSALDNESEALVQDAIKSLKGGRTILMIAHRPSSIATADTVVRVG